MKTTAVVMMLLLAGLQSVAQEPGMVTSDEQGWQKIGETTINLNQENESIIVMGTDEFSALKLKVTDARIKIERVQVFYAAGEMQELDVDSDLLAGAETEELQLDHKDREIEKVAFTYRAPANAKGDKAHLELHGLKTDIQNPSNAYRHQQNPAKTDSATDQTIDNNETQIDSATQRAEEAMTDSATMEAGQELNDAAENIEDDVEEGAERFSKDVPQNPQNASDDVSEAAANTAAGIADKISKDKIGPEGQIIYIDKDSKYYYINEEGKKVFIGKNQLKNKKVD